MLVAVHCSRHSSSVLVAVYLDVLFVTVDLDVYFACSRISRYVTHYTFIGFVARWLGPINVYCVSSVCNGCGNLQFAYWIIHSGMGMVRVINSWM